MFADENNKDMLIDLIESFLDMQTGEISDVIVFNPEITVESVKEKFSQLDIFVQTGNEQIDLEMQTENQEDFADRALVYWSKMASQDVKSGEPYSKYLSQEYF